MATSRFKSSVELTGVVLGTRDFSDSHRIVEVLTAEEGRLSLLARGARASKKRFAGALDVFATLRMQVTPSKNLWTLNAVDIVDARLGLRSDFDAIMRASRLTELARALTPEHQTSLDILNVLIEALDRVAEGQLASAASAYPAFLAAAGVLPPVAHCVACSSTDRDGYILDRGFVCQRCGTGPTRLSDAVRRVWAGERCRDLEVANDVEESVLTYSESALGLHFKSRGLKV